MGAFYFLYQNHPSIKSRIATDATQAPKVAGR